MSNGDSNGYHFQLEKLTYGDLRRLRTIDQGNASDLAFFDDVLDRAIVGGIDAVPLTEASTVIRALMKAMNEAMSPSGPPAAP